MFVSSLEFLLIFVLSVVGGLFTIMVIGDDLQRMKQGVRCMSRRGTTICSHCFTVGKSRNNETMLYSKICKVPLLHVRIMWNSSVTDYHQGMKTSAKPGHAQVFLRQCNIASFMSVTWATCKEFNSWLEMSRKGTIVEDQPISTHMPRRGTAMRSPCFVVGISGNDGIMLYSKIYKGPLLHAKTNTKVWRYRLPSEDEHIYEARWCSSLSEAI